MTRNNVIAIAAALIAAAALAACKAEGDAAGPDGGKPIKQICKMNNQCWICPDEAALKKCILNPATSGCKQATEGECQ